MLSTILAERYAKALLKASQEAGDLADTCLQAAALEQVLTQDESLRRFLTRPSKSAAEKMRLFSDNLTADGGLTRSLLKFLGTIFENKREAFLPVMLRKFQDQVDEAGGVSKAELVSAFELSPAELDLVAKGLSAKIGRAVELKPLVDPQLIGGLKLKLGDRIYDGSLASQLSRLASRLVQGPRKRSAKAQAKLKKSVKKASKPKAKLKGKAVEKKAIKKRARKK